MNRVDRFSQQGVTDEAARQRVDSYKSSTARTIAGLAVIIFGLFLIAIKLPICGVTAILCGLGIASGNGGGSSVGAVDRSYNSVYDKSPASYHPYGELSYDASPSYGAPPPGSAQEYSGYSGSSGVSGGHGNSAYDGAPPPGSASAYTGAPPPGHY